MNKVIRISRQKAAAIHKKFASACGPLSRDYGSILLPYGCKLVRNNNCYVVYGYSYDDSDCKRFCAENNITY
jgi:hypothetical protein